MNLMHPLAVDNELFSVEGSLPYIGNAQKHLRIYVSSATPIPLIYRLVYIVMKLSRYSSMQEMFRSTARVAQENRDGAFRELYLVDIPVSDFYYPALVKLTDVGVVRTNMYSTRVMHIDEFVSVLYDAPDLYEFGLAPLYSNSSVNTILSQLFPVFFPILHPKFKFCVPGDFSSSDGLIPLSVLELPVMNIDKSDVRKIVNPDLDELLYLYLYTGGTEITHRILVAIPHLLLFCRHAQLSRIHQRTAFNQLICTFQVNNSTIILSSLKTINTAQLQPSNIKINTPNELSTVINNREDYFPITRVNDDGQPTVGVTYTTKTESLVDYLAEQIRVRYGFFARPRSGLSNVIIDSFFPRLLYHYRFDMRTLHQKETIPSTAVAISRLVADTLQVKAVPINQLIRVIGYTEKDITILLKAVKAKSLTMVLAGLGGTGMNTIYWLSELCSMCNVVNLFADVHAYEKETVEISNMLRFPFGYSAYERVNYLGRDKAYKSQLALPFLTLLSRNKPITHDKYIQRRNIYTGSDTWATSTYTPEGYVYTTAPNTFIYGAPNIGDRNDMAELGCFIAATHADNNCSIWLNPEQDTDIQVESYGMIQLGSFFMNQLRMAIGLLELLASDQPLNEKDKHVMTFSFDGTIQLPTERQYNWQINNNLRMATEEQATL